MATSPERHWFDVHAVDSKGNPSTYTVRKRGRTVYIHGLDGRRHLCHPSVVDVDGVKREIAIVFQARVTRIET
ncbi:hypothetical protein ABU614_01120 [Lysobacter firmicutimachus]|uniref:Uncharacterized protein n=1 Tax=Lysobacter firmicutimachus TaxID=1792846 RepID=A0AAU8MTA2_9GAMM